MRGKQRAPELRAAEQRASRQPAWQGPTSAWWREVAVVTAALVVSAVLLVAFHFGGDPVWLRRHLEPVAGSDAALWAVQTTFLSVGFAGLTIAAQLFAEAPLAIGTSRKRVLAYIGASWFVTGGLAANAVMGLETIWLPSAAGVLLAFAWFIATAALLLVSTSRLTHLFGHPSRLDEVVRASMVDALSDRLDQVARRYSDARKGLSHLIASGEAPADSSRSASTLKVPVPEAGRVVKAIRLKAVRQASASIGLPAIGRGSEDRGPVDDYASHRIMLDVHPGDRTRLGDTAFRVVTSTGLDSSTAARVVRLLQSSIAVEPREAVTPYEETEREIDTMKDAIGTNLRSGALSTAERALELLGHVVRGAWMTELDRSVASHPGASLTRGIGLFHTIAEVEEDVLLSPQVAHVFVSAATTRALEAPGTGSPEYVDECLQSFTRQWSDILRHGGPEFEELPPRIVACVRDLAEYSDPSAEEPDVLQSRGIWTMVELVKVALDANRPDAARMAAEELRQLFDSDTEGAARSQVRAGLLVLSGWLQYLASTKDERYPADPALEAILVSDGSWRDLVVARGEARAGTPFSRWDTWEANSEGPERPEDPELPDFIDRAQLTAFAGSSGSVPAVTDRQTASDYGRLLRLMPDVASDGHAGPGLHEQRGLLREGLQAEIDRWDAARNDRPAPQPLSASRIQSLAVSLHEALDERTRLAEQLPADTEAPATDDDRRPVLGMNFRVPRRYLVDEGAAGADSDAEALGRMIADAFTEAEDRKVVGDLQALQETVLSPTAAATRQAVEALRERAQDFVLLTPYGGYDGRAQRYPADLTEALDRVTPIETGALDDEAILFDRRKTLRSSRRPADREGMSPVEGTEIALGVFEEVDQSVIRVEAAEQFLVWPGEAPRVFRLRASSA